MAGVIVSTVDPTLYMVFLDDAAGDFVCISDATVASAVGVKQCTGATLNYTAKTLALSNTTLSDYDTPSIETRVSGSFNWK
ncbi:MAG: hypothetical protein WAQ08_13520 [Aquabacterium sp.]|uniref:hypothetical protein n=1 Tax=Aquabacterium sp. TaxID=1872578 RepID=UPI003BB07003